MDPWNSGTFGAFTMTLTNHVRAASEKYDIPEAVVWSMIWQESRGNTFACRYEPKFFIRYLINKRRKDLAGHVPSGVPTLYTERMLRATSFGLLQIMGDTARWFGKIKNDYLYVPLIDPAVNIDLGIRFLRHLTDKHGGDILLGLKHYNGSPEYPNIILDHVRKKAYLPLLEGGV